MEGRGQAERKHWRKGKGGKKKEGGSFKVPFILQAKACWPPVRLWDRANKRISDIGLKIQIFI